MVKKINNCDCVIACCTENIYWIFDKINDYNKIYIYSKCEKEFDPMIYNHDKIIIKKLNNIGSCDYVYLYHIIEHWKNLPDKIDFRKGTPNCNYKSKVKYDKNILKFSLNEWKFTNNKTKNFKFVKSKFKNFQEWIYFTFGYNLGNKLINNKDSYIYYCGNFNATRKQIKNIDLKFYIRMIKQIKYPNEEIDHFIERIWGMIFSLKTYNFSLFYLIFFILFILLCIFIKVK